MDKGLPKPISTELTKVKSPYESRKYKYGFRKGTLQSGGVNRFFAGLAKTFVAKNSKIFEEVVCK